MIIHLTSLVTWLCFREDFLHVGLHHLCNLWHGNNDYNYRAGQVGQFPPSFITSKLYSANDPDWHFSFFHLYLFEGGSMPRVGERCRSWELRFRLSWSWRTLWRKSARQQVTEYNKVKLLLCIKSNNSDDDPFSNFQEWLIFWSMLVKANFDVSLWPFTNLQKEVWKF